MLIKNGLVYNSDTGRFDSKNILVRNGVVEAMGAISDTDDEILDVKRSKIIPGLVDVHTHGRAGFDFLSDDPSALSTIAESFAKKGVTSVMPAIASDALEKMIALTDKINKFIPGENEASYCGVHFEGRYMNPKKKGAHAEKFLAALEPSELDDEVFRMCKSFRVSAAYELDKSGEFLKKVLSIGASASLAHTDATYSEARSLEERGLNAYTHLFNTMPPIHHRDGGPILAALTGGCYAELICDGIHISPEMIKFAFSHLTEKRCVLVSDSMEATGSADGEYSIAGNLVYVRNGIARTESGALAGSTLDLFDGMKNLMRFCDIPLSQAIPTVTSNPCRMIGVYDKYGSIDVGKSADMIVLTKEKEINIDKVILRGNLIQ